MTIEKGGNRMSLYEIAVKTIAGEETTLEAYKGKVLLIVNTASKCGLTPQYKGLQALYESYREQGFEVLGFPCNQFAGQEPGSEEEIAHFCDVNYGVTFPLFAKIDVNGADTHPLYQYLKEHAPDNESQDIEWNFAKFLIDRNGQVVKRIGARVLPEELVADIEALLK
jgi:glutathione peroxidase